MSNELNNIYKEEIKKSIEIKQQYGNFIPKTGKLLKFRKECFHPKDGEFSTLLYLSIEDYNSSMNIKMPKWFSDYIDGCLVDFQKHIYFCLENTITNFGNETQKMVKVLFKQDIFYVPNYILTYI